MRKLRKWITALAVIFWMGIATQANAVIELRSGGNKGDALLFPVFAGQFESYFTIMNDVRDSSPVDDATNQSNHWIQGHIRFWGAAWSGELFDTDIILSPNDVFVFRIADVDGDGFWEIDQSLDPENWEYTGTLSNCYAANLVPGQIPPAAPARTMCIDYSSMLIPPTISQAVIDFHRNWGYVEFIAEGVLNGMTHEIMSKLINPANKGMLESEGQKKLVTVTDQAGNIIATYGGLGTHLWSWTKAGTKGVDKGAGALDVDNVLSGTAFVAMLPATSYGLAYNAEALYNFRTNFNPHRIDNYSLPGLPDATGAVINQTGVILHDEDVNGPKRGTSPVGDYVYGYPFSATGGKGFEFYDDRQEEAQMYFSATWGPTLVDGDDYDPIPIDPTKPNVTIPMNGKLDTWDAALTHNNSPAKGPDNINSITEVEEAIRLYGQRYSSFFFDGEINNLTPGGAISYVTFDPICAGGACSAVTLWSWYQVFFPTKHFYGVSLPLPNDFQIYLKDAVNKLLYGSGTPKLVGIDVWDISENAACDCPCCEEITITEHYDPIPCTASPCNATGGRRDVWTIRIKCQLQGCFYTIPHESTIFNIDNVKQSILSQIDYAHANLLIQISEGDLSMPEEVLSTSAEILPTYKRVLRKKACPYLSVREGFFPLSEVENNLSAHLKDAPPSVLQKAKEAIEEMKRRCELKIGQHKQSAVDGVPYGKFAFWPYVYPPTMIPPVSSNYNDPQTSLFGTPESPPSMATMPYLAYTFELKQPIFPLPVIAYHWRQMQR